jgi:outer membrane protein OmpA-like peptidoglycan-associated protein
MYCLSSFRCVLILVTFLGAFTLLEAQDLSALVSPFQGSTVLGTYESRFASLTLLSGPLDSKKVPTGTQSIEGALNSIIYTRPEGISEFEVYSSYKKVLANAGFDFLLDCKNGECNAKKPAKEAYGYPNKEIENRDYGKMPTSTTTWLTGWVTYYLSAKKKTADKTYYVMILISTQRDLYSVDVLAVDEMEEGTVELAPELLKAKIADEGKAILDGLYFETGQAVLTDQSQPALNAIAIYLKDNAALSYYVVGHTDDTGNWDSNLSLSKNRALAVIEALKKNGVDTVKLTGYGVGPFAPVSTNQSDAGKSKNRRVELVLRLD